MHQLTAKQLQENVNLMSDDVSVAANSIKGTKIRNVLFQPHVKGPNYIN